MTDEREDLIERLATAYESTGDPLYYAAADALERLERERDEARADCIAEEGRANRIGSDLMNCRAEVDRLHSVIESRHGGEPLALLAELDEARARVQTISQEYNAATLESGRQYEALRARLAERKAEAARLRGLLRRLHGLHPTTAGDLGASIRAALAEAPGDEGGDDDQ